MNFLNSFCFKLRTFINPINQTLEIKTLIIQIMLFAGGLIMLVPSLHPLQVIQWKKKMEKIIMGIPFAKRKEH